MNEDPKKHIAKQHLIKAILWATPMVICGFLTSIVTRDTSDYFIGVYTIFGLGVAYHLFMINKLYPTYKQQEQRFRSAKEMKVAELEYLQAKDDVDSIDDIKKIRQRLRFVELQSKELDNKLKALPLEEFELRKQMELERMKYETEKEKLMRDLRGF